MNEEQFGNGVHKCVIDMQGSKWTDIVEIKRRTKGSKYHNEIRELID